MMGLGDLALRMSGIWRDVGILNIFFTGEGSIERYLILILDCSAHFKMTRCISITPDIEIYNLIGILTFLWCLISSTLHLVFVKKNDCKTVLLSSLICIKH